MISVLDNINTVNYIIQNCIQETKMETLRERNSFLTGEGYAMDVTCAGKSWNLNVRTDMLQQLCRISFMPDGMLVRYGPKFMFRFNKKTQLFTTNLFDEAFTLDEIEGVFFTQNVAFEWDLQIKFDTDIMINTLTQCRRLYDDYLVSIKK